MPVLKRLKPGCVFRLCWSSTHDQLFMILADEDHNRISRILASYSGNRVHEFDVGTLQLETTLPPRMSQSAVKRGWPTCQWTLRPDKMSLAALHAWVDPKHLPSFILQAQL